MKKETERHMKKTKTKSCCASVGKTTKTSVLKESVCINNKRNGIFELNFFQFLDCVQASTCTRTFHVKTKTKSKSKEKEKESWRNHLNQKHFHIILPDEFVSLYTVYSVVYGNSEIRYILQLFTTVVYGILHIVICPQ